MKSLYIKLGLNQLRCHKKPEAWAIAEPYIWNSFFKIDGTCVHLTEDFRLDGDAEIHFSPGSHGNLFASGIRTGDVIGIPKEVGEWRTKLEPIKVPYFDGEISGICGVITVLMEQNYVSIQGAEAGHMALNEFIKGAFRDAVRGFDPKKVDIHDIDGSIKTYFDHQAKQFTEKIGNLVGDAVVSAQSVLQNLMSLVKKDGLIGFKVWDFSTIGIENTEGVIELKERFNTKKYGEWEIRGTMKAAKDPFETNIVAKKKSGEEE